MVDYCLGQEYADILNQLGAIKAKTIFDYGFKQNANDDELVDATRKHGCILLTRDKNTINERTYEPCQHGGIIIIKERRPFPESVFESMKALCESGERALTLKHVTHLTKYSARVITHKGDHVITFD